jgi:hypothetical protein
MLVQLEQQPPLPARRRCGISSLEVLVSLTLLTSVLALATPLIVAHGRLLKQQRYYRLALDELSNQHERLSTLPAEELSAAIEALTPSPLATERLPGAALRGELADARFGRRLTLEIWWDEPNRDAAPVRLTAWFASAAGNANREEERR